MTTIGAFLPPPRSNIRVRISAPTLPPPTTTSVPCSGPFTTGSAPARQPIASGSINVARTTGVDSFIESVPSFFLGGAAARLRDVLLLHTVDVELGRTRDDLVERF